MTNQHTHFYDLSNRDKLESDPVTPVFSLTVLFAHVGQCFINRRENLVCQTESAECVSILDEHLLGQFLTCFNIYRNFFFFLPWKAAGCKQENGKNVIKTWCYSIAGGQKLHRVPLIIIHVELCVYLRNVLVILHLELICTFKDSLAAMIFIPKLAHMCFFLKIREYTPFSLPQDKITVMFFWVCHVRHHKQGRAESTTEASQVATMETFLKITYFRLFLKPNTNRRMFEGCLENKTSGTSMEDITSCCEKGFPSLLIYTCDYCRVIWPGNHYWSHPFPLETKARR